MRKVRFTEHQSIAVMSIPEVPVRMSAVKPEPSC